MSAQSRPVYFKSQSDFRAWLETNHSKERELLVGFFKKGSGKPSITWPEAVDEALCFGWIDGVRKRVDEARYTIRFTPRTTRSTWSAVNIKRAKELKKQGLMFPAGIAAFEKRSEERSRIYSYERQNAALDPAFEKKFRANKKAWAFFNSQTPSYKRTAVWWVISAKKEETRLRRLDTLIKESSLEKVIPPLAPPSTNQ
jgi:uncharacterized protein YdeI (YjbR/CyaY-like superfamily)